MLGMQEHRHLSSTLTTTAGGVLRAASEGVAGAEAHDKHSNHIHGGCLVCHGSMCTTLLHARPVAHLAGSFGCGVLFQVWQSSPVQPVRGPQHVSDLRSQGLRELQTIEA